MSKISQIVPCDNTGSNIQTQFSRWVKGEPAKSCKQTTNYLMEVKACMVQEMLKIRELKHFIWS